MESINNKPKRLYFIDAVRAFAILMMLQGHFIDTLLDVSYRLDSSLAFNVWKYFRGITAPTFFTISGLVFSYLLLKANEKGTVKTRIRKGLYRGVMLIFIGYLLRAPILKWLSGEFSTYFLTVDVLHCIGLSLILVILIYILTLRKVSVFAVLMFLIGTLIFMTEPLYRNLSLPNTNKFLANYLTKDYGSVFTIIPWFGYMAYGSFIATLFFKYLNTKAFKIKIVISFLVLGLILVYKSSTILMYLYEITNIDLCKGVSQYNYLFIRLGNVFVIFAIFYIAEDFIRKSTIFNKIGQKTLSIYVIHFIILYGCFTGLGLHQLIGKTLNPIQVISGAILFLVIVCIISFNYAKTNAFLYSWMRKRLNR